MDLKKLADHVTFLSRSWTPSDQRSNILKRGREKKGKKDATFGKKQRRCIIVRKDRGARHQTDFIDTVWRFDPMSVHQDNELVTVCH